MTIAISIVFLVVCFFVGVFLRFSKRRLTERIMRQAARELELAPRCAPPGFVFYKPQPDKMGNPPPLIVVRINTGKN